MSEEIDFSIDVHRINGKYAIQLRRIITDTEQAKQIVSMAMNGAKFDGRIKLRDRLMASAKFKEAGLYG